MGKLRNIFISEYRVYDDPNNPETSDYDVALTLTVPEAVIDPKTGENLTTMLTKLTDNKTETGDFLQKINALQDDLSDHKKLTGNENLYGHVKLTDDIDSTAKADDGIGISPFAMAKLRAEMSEKMYSTLPFPAQALIRVTSSAGGAALANIPFTVSENGGADMVYTSNSGGTISVAGVNGDKLVIKPSLAGLLWTSNPTSATLTLATDKTVETAFTLTPIPVGTVKIVATDSSGTRQSGRKFTVTVSGTAAKTMTTNTNGEIAVEADSGKTVTATLADLAYGASVDVTTLTKTVVAGQTVDAKFTLSHTLLNQTITYNSSTVTFDALIKTIDAEVSGGGGGGGAKAGNGGPSAGKGGNGVVGEVTNYTLVSRTLTITIGAGGNGGVYATNIPAGTNPAHNGSDGGKSSITAGESTIVSGPGGGGGGAVNEYTPEGGGSGLRLEGNNPGSPSGIGSQGGAAANPPVTGATKDSRCGSPGISGYAKITIRG